MSIEIPKLLLPEAQVWGVAHARSRCEKMLADFFKENHIPHYLPLVRHRNLGNREVRFFYHPLFPGYVFYDVSAIIRQDVFGTRKVAQVLETTDPERLRHELTQLAHALQKDDTLSSTRYKEKGKPVRVKRGMFKGVEGEIVRIDGASRLIIRISFISQGAELAIDEGMVEPIL